MNEGRLKAFLEAVKRRLREIADMLPLPLHYLLDLFFIAALTVDLVIPDALPFVDEVLGIAGLYYYNAYLFRRTVSRLNPKRIWAREAPGHQKRLGLLPYREDLDRLRARLRELKKEAAERKVPGLEPEKLARIEEHVKEIEQRLGRLDAVLLRGEEQRPRLERKASLSAPELGGPESPEVKETAEIARRHLEHLNRLQQERNRLAARVEKFSMQADALFTQLLAAASPRELESETEKLIQELVGSVESFDRALAEISADNKESPVKSALEELAGKESGPGADGSRNREKPGGDG